MNCSRRLEAYARRVECGLVVPDLTYLQPAHQKSEPTFALACISQGDNGRTFVNITGANTATLQPNLRVSGAMIFQNIHLHLCCYL